MRWASLSVMVLGGTPLRSRLSLVCPGSNHNIQRSLVSQGTVHLLWDKLLWAFTKLSSFLELLNRKKNRLSVSLSHIKLKVVTIGSEHKYFLRLHSFTDAANFFGQLKPKCSNSCQWASPVEVVLSHFELFWFFMARQQLSNGPKSFLGRPSQEKLYGS